MRLRSQWTQIMKALTGLAKEFRLVLWTMRHFRRC